MDDKLRELGAPLITIATVPDQQLRQIAKLLDGEIRRQTRLATFLANDTDPDIRCLDHGHVVAAVADAARALPGVGADELGDVGFLGGRAAAGDDGGKADGGGDEGFAVVGQH